MTRYRNLATYFYKKFRFPDCAKENDTGRPAKKKPMKVVGAIRVARYKNLALIERMPKPREKSRYKPYLANDFPHRDHVGVLETTFFEKLL